MDSKFLKISNKLSEYHSIFSKIWQLGRVVWTTNPKIPTAAIQFNMDGNFLAFLFNEDFYNKLSDDELCMIICHECLHVILNHGIRSKSLPHKELANVAMDVVINEVLINDFGFDREMSVCKEAWFLDVFKEKFNLPNLESNRNFEYYYESVVNSDAVKELKNGSISLIVIDNHDGLPMYSDGQIEDLVSRLSEKEKDMLNEARKTCLTNKQELQLSKGQSDGDSSFSWNKVELEKVPKIEWQESIKGTIIKKFRERYKYQWYKTNRHMSLIDPKHFLIPTEAEVDDNSKLLDTVFFVDVSGSCHSYVPKFVSAASQIPSKFFSVEAYAFDSGTTKVKLTDKEFPYGGSTAFHQLEELLLKRKVYPQIVFVMTDGDGTVVNPKYPHRWHVYLTKNGHKGCFPKGVQFFELGF